jgi:hypothetical protein
MGYFSTDSLKKFNQMCADGMDFAEDSTYDFTRCILPSGEFYGTAGRCQKGKPTADKAKGSSADLYKIMAAYKKKMGKTMPIKLVADAAKRIGVPIPDGMGAGLSNVSERLKKSGKAAK